MILNKSGIRAGLGKDAGGGIHTGAAAQFISKGLVLLGKCFIRGGKHKDGISLGSSPKGAKINNNKRN